MAGSAAENRVVYPLQKWAVTRSSGESVQAGRASGKLGARPLLMGDLRHYPWHRRLAA